MSSSTPPPSPPPGPAPAASSGHLPPVRGEGDRPNAHSAGRWKRRLPWIGGAGLLALIVVGLWPQALLVEMTVARREALRVTIDEEGRTQVRHRYLVAAPVAGHLRRIELRSGDPIVAGETVIAVLETAGADLLDARSLAQAEARVRAAESARALAAAQAERARSAWDLMRSEAIRAERLFAEGTLAQAERDRAATAAATAAQEERAATFALQVAEFELEQTRALLLRGTPAGATTSATLEIRAPVDGRVLRVLQESARLVPGGFPLLEVGDPTDLEVRIEVLSRDAVAINPGARVLLEQWGGDGVLEARVRRVEPSAFTKISALGVEEQRVNVLADFVSPPAARGALGDQFRVEARIITWEDGDVLVVPSGALFQRDGRWWVFVVEGGRARLRSVEIGRGNGARTEVRRGLEAGDRVVDFPGDRVADGVRVKPIVVSDRP
jgi:HlyD family secretion protein